MANEKRLIDIDDAVKKLEQELDTECEPETDNDSVNERFIKRVIPKLIREVINWLKKQPTVDAVEVDLIAKMLYDFTGDLCPCNYSPWDEWLSERCELQDECPNPADELGCWKQFVKLYTGRKDNG